MKLFDRHPRGLTLTYEGHRLLAHCRNILSAVESAGYAMTRPTHDISGSIQLAVTITISGYFLAPLLARFRQRFPAIEVSIQEVKRSDIEAGLVSGKYELGLMLVSNLSKHADLVSHTLVRSMRAALAPLQASPAQCRNHHARRRRTPALHPASDRRRGELNSLPTGKLTSSSPISSCEPNRSRRCGA